MKKIYNQPTCMVVELSIRNKVMFLSGSLDDSKEVSNDSQFLTKENKDGDTGGKNVWDEEW